MSDSRDTDRPDGPPVKDYDPFETFNRAQGIGSVRDPYERFREDRRRCPVQHVSAEEIARGQGKHTLPGVSDIYAILDHAGVSRVLRDGKVFTSQVYAKSMGIVMGHTILEMDEPEHSRYRGLIQKAFTKRALERWEHELVRPTVNGLIDRFVDRGQADLVRELTFPFPVTVIAGMLGLPEADRTRFHAWAIELIGIGIDPARGIAASQSLADYFEPLIAERRKSPRDDLISVLAAAELDGTRLSDDQICAFLRLLLPAGAETTYRSSSNLFYGLLTHPDQLGAVRDDRSLVDPAIEEGLRWEPPLIGIMRGVAEDAEVAGVKLPAGATLSVCIGAANRDEGRYNDPDRFDIWRKPRQHMAFGFGAHRCLGMHLARMESQVVLNAVLDRLPGLRLDPDAGPVHITGATFRAPTHLPVLFD